MVGRVSGVEQEGGEVPVRLKQLLQVLLRYPRRRPGPALQIAPGPGLGRGVGGRGVGVVLGRVAGLLDVGKLE